jgi:HEAT repeat protein
VEELIDLLDDTDRDVRREAARALGQIGDPRAVPALIEKARDDVAGIELDAVEALGRMSTPESTQFLVRMLEDPRPAVRISAALGLGNSGASEAAAPLERLLRHEHSVPVFVTAAEALGRVAGLRALHQLRLLLARATRDVVRRELANAIADLLGPPDEFYRLLQADPMQQEELVVTSLQRSRQVLAARAGSDSREYVTDQVQRALTALTGGDYAAVAQSLYRAATRALVAASRSREYARLLAERRHEVPVTTRNRRLRVLLGMHEKLRANYGFLGGLREDADHRALSLEEGLLATFAFRRIAIRLDRLRRPNADGDERNL